MLPSRSTLAFRGCIMFVRRPKSYSFGFGVESYNEGIQVNEETRFVYTLVGTYDFAKYYGNVNGKAHNNNQLPHLNSKVCFSAWIYYREKGDISVATRESIVI
jgi:hypothetical protein